MNVIVGAGLGTGPLSRPPCNRPGYETIRSRNPASRLVTHARAGALKVSTMSSPLQKFPSRFTMKLCIGGAALVLVGACSPGPAPVSQSPRDPSSPSAPEGAPPGSVAPATAAPAQPAHEHDHHDHNHAGHAAPASVSGHEGHASAPGASADGGTQGVVYVCPMHPEVTSNAPGICPKCNMKLEPKK